MAYTPPTSTPSGNLLGAPTTPLLGALPFNLSPMGTSSVVPSSWEGGAELSTPAPSTAPAASSGFVGAGGMSAITNPENLFQTIGSGWGNTTTLQPQGSSGKGGVTDVIQAQATAAPSTALTSSAANMFNYEPASTLLQGAGNRAGQPYVYGDLGLTTSDYSIWGSKGNPYLSNGPGYNPGQRWGTPIIPQPIAPTPISPGGDNEFPSAPSTGGDDVGFRDPFNDTPFNSKAFNQLYPGLGLVSGLAYGRIDNPYGEGYARLPWYEGSAGNGYGYTEEGYDQYAPGDTDRGIYDAATGERTWGDEFDDYNTNDLWAQTSFYEGIGNLIGGRTWDGLEAPAIFGDPKSELAQEATQLQLAEKAEKEANRQALLDAEQAKIDAENAKWDAQQAEWDAQYAQINDLNTNQISIMNDIKTDMIHQYGTFQDEVMSQIAAENASMFDSFAEYKEWMGEQFTTQQSGLDEALTIAAAKAEGLNSNQIDLMNQIAEDMKSDYGTFSGGVEGQLEQMAAENASMFDSLEEYQAWNSDNVPDSGSSDDGGWGDTDTSEGTTAGDYAEAGFSQEDADFANSGFDDDSDGGWGDWGGDDTGGYE